LALLRRVPGPRPIVTTIPQTQSILPAMADSTLSALATRISRLQDQTQQAAIQQVNYWLTVRN
jgi:hypothetical protein